eukprot:1195273-Prorocentrum_minimum.AAC.3
MPSKGEVHVHAPAAARPLVVCPSQRTLRRSERDGAGAGGSDQTGSPGCSQREGASGEVAAHQGSGA